MRQEVCQSIIHSCALFNLILTTALQSSCCHPVSHFKKQCRRTQSLSKTPEPTSGRAQSSQSGLSGAQPSISQALPFKKESIWKSGIPSGHNDLDMIGQKKRKSANYSTILRAQAAMVTLLSAWLATEELPGAPLYALLTQGLGWGCESYHIMGLGSQTE